MTSYDGQTSVIRRVSVSATNVPNFATILKGVCGVAPVERLRAKHHSDVIGWHSL
ncbi:hypothetical protein DPMN_089312 [Dreissena polymorpha]|uniref:Uncharacterized protein n=1 Tax=Dreissena polymorpha TaxID=45954 RepID=A0A9D4KW58_DREPO|nr:hypothetical protein DPMN_089312 [Dreissena polymorpha]